jgi:estrone sulfotransferase
MKSMKVIFHNCVTMHGQVSFKSATKKNIDSFPDPRILERKKYYTHPATFNTNMVRSEPMNMYMPAKFPEMAERIWHFKPRPDDVWIITYPKCGTTLTQELMWQVAHGVNLDSEESQKNIFLRVPFLEFTALQTSVMPVPSLETDDPMNMMARMMNDTVAWTEKAAGPRIIKTHLPMCMLPPDLCDISKVIYVGRYMLKAH